MDKSKLRATAAWKKHRLAVAEKDEKIDYITQKKLRKGFSCHHLDQRKENYDKLDDLDRFLSLNKKSHDALHFIYPYWLKDEKIIDRIVDALNKMKKYSND